MSSILLNVIESLLCLDPSKRATVPDVLKCRLFGGKIKKSQEDEIWQEKVNPDDLEMMIGLSASNPLLTVKNLLDQRKSYDFPDASEIFFQSELTIDKGNEQKSSDLKAAELNISYEKLPDRCMARPSVFCN